LPALDEGSIALAPKNADAGADHPRSCLEGTCMSTGSTPPVPPSRPRRLGLPAVAGIAIAVLVIAGVVGYLIGHGSGDDSGKTTGYRDGRAAGKAQVQANYAQGKPGYQAIYDAGQTAGLAAGKKAGEAEGQKSGEAAGQRSGEAKGQKVGFDQGQQVGIKSGQREGVQQGAAAALGGFTDWTNDDFYIVTMAPGSQASGLPTVIATRKTIEPDTNYRLCQNTDAGGASISELCQSPVLQASNSSAGGGTSTGTSTTAGG
jgi:hypothetical protein